MPELQYRFRGHLAPNARAKTPILAEAPAADLTDGVAKLRLYDPIDSWGGDWGISAKEFAAALDELGDDITDIHLHINSPGGEVFEGITILNALRNHPARVTAVVDGLAASAASFIATGADTVVMGRNTELMIHDAWGIAIGPAADMRDMADRLDHLSNNIASVYAEKAGGDIAAWRSAMLAESWYTAHEAVEAGLADRVEGAQDAPKNAFDLSVFKHAGRAEAPAPPVPVAHHDDEIKASNVRVVVGEEIDRTLGQLADNIMYAGGDGDRDQRRQNYGYRGRKAAARSNAAS